MSFSLTHKYLKKPLIEAIFLTILVGLIPQDPELMLNKINCDMATAGTRLDYLTNEVRPISLGGTGASSEAGARNNLSLGVALMYNAAPWFVWRNGGYMYVVAVGVSTGAGPWDNTRCPYMIPSQYRPIITVAAPVITTNGASTTGGITAGSDGVITVGNYGSTGSSDLRSGVLMWPCNGM